MNRITRAFLTTLVGASLFATIPTASAQQVGVVMQGVGLTSCGYYNSIRVGADRQQVELTYFSWAQGYLSRLNNYESELANVPKIDLQPGTFGVASQISWMNNWCSSYPSRTYHDGVFELYKYLIKLNGFS